MYDADGNVVQHDYEWYEDYGEEYAKYGREVRHSLTGSELSPALKPDDFGDEDYESKDAGKAAEGTNKDDFKNVFTNASGETYDEERRKRREKIEREKQERMKRKSK